MPQARSTHDGGSPPLRRLYVYIEPDLYEWIHRQAASQQRSMSSWMRYVAWQLRAGLQPQATGGTLPGGSTGTQDEGGA